MRTRFVLFNQTWENLAGFLEADENIRSWVVVKFRVGPSEAKT